MEAIVQSKTKGRYCKSFSYDPDPEPEPDPDPDPEDPEEPDPDPENSSVQVIFTLVMFSVPAVPVSLSTWQLGKPPSPPELSSTSKKML